MGKRDQRHGAPRENVMTKKGDRKKVEVRLKSSSDDFINKMPDDVLVMILSFLPIKGAVVTSSLSRRWRFLWCNLIRLNFDGTQTLDNSCDCNPEWCGCYSEWEKYINQVNSVIQSYNHQTVQDFRIRFNLDKFYIKDNEIIDDWIQFAVNKNVENFELDLNNSHVHYEFPFSKWMFSKSKFGELVPLKTLILNNVDVREEILQEVLTNSPHLETLSIHNSGYLTHISVAGRALNLKHFEIVDCDYVKSILLYDFDLKSFTYEGSEIELLLIYLPKLKKVDMCQRPVGLSNEMFSQISSYVSTLHTLSFKIFCPKKSVKLDSLPMLQNVKKLILTIGAWADNCLLEFASIIHSCPNLETFIVKFIWCLPTIKSGIARHVVTNPHQHLKLFQIRGYYGRICDFELAAYIINNAVALEKIVIDPFCQDEVTRKRFLKEEKVARRSAKSKVEPIVPTGVELVIL